MTIFEPASFETWRARVERDLGAGAIEQRLTTRLLEGIAVSPLHSGPAVADAGLPGQPPFVRGASSRAPVAAPRYRISDLGTAERWLAEDQAGGAEGAWLVLPDLPARTVRSLSRILENNDPSPLLLDAGPDALVALAMCEAASFSHPLWLGADPLSAFAVSGILPGSLDAFEAELAETVSRVEARGRDDRAVVVSSVHHHEAGAHAVLELAYALATLAGYLRGAERRGISPAHLARRSFLRVAVGGDVFLEIAKLRALRGLTHHTLASSGVDDVSLPIHAVSSPRSLSRRDPYVNMLRVTTQIFAAVVGGAEIVTPLPFDETLGLPDKLGRRVARNTLAILRDEAHLGWVHDPAGGSWYVESLSDELARSAWNALQRIEAAGGMVRHIASGALRSELEDSQRVRRLAIARRKLPLVGVTEFADLEERLIKRPPVSTPTLDESPVGRKLASFDELVEAAREGASLEAMGRALDRGAPVVAPVPRPHRDAEEIELLRAAAEGLRERPTVLLACLGPPSEHRPRVAFSRAFFAALGIGAPASEGTGDEPPPVAAGKLGAALIMAQAKVACLCGSDERYASHALEAVEKLKEAGAERVMFAGRPGDRESALRTAGVDDFIYVGRDLPASGAALLRALGARVPRLVEEDQR